MSHGIVFKLKPGEDATFLQVLSQFMTLVHREARGQEFMVDFPDAEGQPLNLGSRVKVMSAPGHLNRICQCLRRQADMAPAEAIGEATPMVMETAMVRIRQKGKSHEKRAEERKASGKTTRPGRFVRRPQAFDARFTIPMVSKTTGQVYPLVLRRLPAPTTTPRGSYGV